MLVETKDPYDFSHLKIDPDKPVCFLDLCGVLNNYLGVEFEWYRDIVNERSYGVGDRVDGIKADLLFSLFKHHDVQVVFITSWVTSGLDAKHQKILELKEFFKYDNILGSTITSGGYHRGKGVMYCVKQHKLTKWFVLDDSENMHPPHIVPQHRFFNPHGRYGITDQLLEQIHLYIASMKLPKEDS